MENMNILLSQVYSASLKNNVIVNNIDQTINLKHLHQQQNNSNLNNNSNNNFTCYNAQDMISDLIEEKFVKDSDKVCSIALKYGIKHCIKGFY
jgi:hypothetical protein